MRLSLCAPDWNEPVEETAAYNTLVMRRITFPISALKN